MLFIPERRFIRPGWKAYVLRIAPVVITQQFEVEVLLLPELAKGKKRIRGNTQS